MDAYFTELGRMVLARWKAKNFALADFPKIAGGVLAERPPGEAVDLGDFVREFLLDDEQPPQTGSGFGQPELIVYDCPHFYIQLLFWLDGTTQIHQHEFSGVFHVLAGSSLHSEFGFEKAREVTAHFRVGELRLRRTEYLPTGSTRAIVSGREHIHALFHLETPSLTLVIRTHSDPGTGPQFTYLPPHVAVDPFHTDALTARRTQLLDVLEKAGDPSYADLVREMVEELDFERGFFILQGAYAHLGEQGAWPEVWRAFRRRHGALARYVPPVLEELRRRDALTGLRSTITEVEHRFFLAALLNVPNRAALLALVGKVYPGRPAGETVLRWLAELSESAEYSVWILDAEFPGEEGAGPEERAAEILEAIRGLLKPGKGRRIRPEEALVREVLAGSSLRVLVE